MALIQTWSPFRELERFRRDFDDLLERLTNHDNAREKGEELLIPAMESFVEGSKLTVRLDVPGIDPKDIDVKVVGDTLTVHGSRQEDSEKKKRDFIQREVRYGSFQRTMRLPEGLKADDIKAAYHDGVLELTAMLPKALTTKEVKINVEAAAPKKNGAKEQKAA